MIKKQQWQFGPIYGDASPMGGLDRRDRLEIREVTTPKQVKELYAYICTNRDGKEFIPVVSVLGVNLHAVSDSRKHIDKLMVDVQEAVRTNNIDCKLRLVRFTQLEEVEVLQ